MALSLTKKASLAEALSEVLAGEGRHGIRRDDGYAGGQMREMVISGVAGTQISAAGSLVDLWPVLGAGLKLIASRGRAAPRRARSTERPLSSESNSSRPELSVVCFFVNLFIPLSQKSDISVLFLFLRISVVPQARMVLRNRARAKSRAPESGSQQIPTSS